jgi:hypothetical protein
MLFIAGAIQQRAALPDESLPPLGIGAPEQFPGFLPRQIQPPQGGTDGFTAVSAAEPLVPKDTRRRNVQRGFGSAPAIGGSAAACRAARISSPSAASICGQKGGRPPVR